MAAAYAVVLHAFFGGLVLSQNVGAADAAFAVCHGLGDAGAPADGKAPAKSLPCLLCCAVHAAGALPAASASIGIVFSRGAPLPFALAAIPAVARTFSPKLARGPPFSA